jgi:Xaa-Pro aminopeptidase
MRAEMELPRLSIAERDRRWAATRAKMREKGLDCLVLWGWPALWDFYTANARYLCPIGGNAENNVLIFPLHQEPTSFVLMPTFVEYWKRSQNWVSDIRARKNSWADTVVQRLKELKLEKASIGMDGSAGPLDPDGWLPRSIYDGVVSALADARIVDLDDDLELMRSIKSAEEIAMLERAAVLGDRMLQACMDNARPGARETEVYSAMVHAMLSEGGEEPTLFLWACDQHPFPHPFRVPALRRMQANDIIICEIHPKIGGYFTHIERTFCLGQPDRNIQRIHDGCIAAFNRGMELFAPGESIVETLNDVKSVVDQAGLGICELGIHGHGLASLEYPRYRFHALAGDQAALKRGGETFVPGMVFAFNINLFDPQWRGGDTGTVFAETVHITETGARYLHRFPHDLQRIPYH